MDKKGKKWSWSSALVGAATATAATAIILAKPKDPTFHLLSIKPTSLKLNLHTDLILTVHVSNPNIVPIQYSSSSMSIYYGESLLGTAQVQAGSQPAKSCRMLKIPARLDGLNLSHRGGRILSDVARREMVLDAKVDIGGTAKLLWWDHKFNVHVDSHLVIDPLFLDVIDQENKSDLRFFFRDNGGCSELGCRTIMEGKQ